jgi:MSHA biogenesis protein MshQ
LQLEDATFSAIDAGDGSSALQRNVPLSAKVDIGRFVPDYFDVAVSNTPQFRTFDDTACVRSFTYIGQPFGYVTAPQATITARNAGGGATRNYQGVWWRLNPAGVTQTYTSGPGMPALNTSSILTPAITPLNNDTGSGTISVNGSDRIAYVRNAAVPQAPFSASIALAMSVEDASENSGSIATPTPALFIGSGTGIAFDGVGVSNGSEFRYGRLNVVNAYGSDRLPLPITVNAQYWNGTAFVTNAADNCTSLAGTNFALSAGRGAAINTTIQGSGTMVSGIGKIMLTKPTAVTSKGSVIVGPGPAIISYLPGSGVASFGIPNNGPVIYMREIY